MTNTPSSSEDEFLARLGLIEAELAAKAEANPQVEDVTKEPGNLWADFVPDVSDVTGGLPQHEIDADEFMKRISIIDAYKMFGGQSSIARIKKEMKVRCPNPDHEDKDASFSMNTQTNVFNCFKCGGGDVITMGAWAKGYDPQDRTIFRQVKAEIMADFGFETPNPYLITIPDPDPETPPVAPEVSPTPPVQAGMTPDAQAPPVMPERYSSAINWRELLPEKTFARTYMEEVCRDDNPENYHFWASLIAVGLAVGKSRTLFDSPEINPNLFICFTGPSGGGKSKAKRLLMSLLSSALPYSASSLDAAGVSQIRGAASGEVVIKTLVHPLLDANGKPMAGPPIPVTALVEYEEFSEMTTRTGRSGNTLKGLMMNLYGCPEEVRHLSMGNDNTAPQPFTSAITTTQIKAIRDLVDQSDIHSGFVNRWLFVTGPDKEKFPVNRIKLDLTRAGGLLKLIKLHYSGSPRALDWDEDAETLWAEFYRSTIDKHKKENPDDSTKVRIDLVMKKLFLIFMLNEKKDSLTADIVQRVIKLHPYLVSIYDMVEDEVASSELGENEEYLVEIIKKCSIPADGKNPGKGLTVSQMHDKVRRRFKVKKDLNNVVEQLTKADIIEKWELKGRVGRPTAFYTIKGTEVQNAVKS